ncbi:MAG: insulinase family protein, partial [Alistipes sp.]|nr:insulinase family protein [Alistipes sp.]
MRRYFWIVISVLALLSTACGHRYESVKGDKLGTRIYTLDNGLKVYMSVNKEQPRLQTMIAVRVGSKNDPAETTGLAHYFEHLMFKGTDKFGTQNYEAEKPLLDEIERLFEVYRATTDEAERKAIYAQIDSVSQEASKHAIPNEYDKLMQAIGADGTNAWTSFDETNYVEDIPSNQIENWAKIQAERFENAVIRGFHTELETVYEEYNMGLTRDSNKQFDELLALTFPDHPYGTQTTIGKQEHLKNPSITNIKEYYKTYYVPNNMAICMAGDFDPDEAIKIIEKYFGQLKPNNNLPQVEEYKPTRLTEVRESEVYGLESESVAIAWPIGGARSEGALVSEILAAVLSNGGKCGLLDTDLLQTQKVLDAYGGVELLSDAGIALVMGEPKQGQSLEEVRDLLLAEIAKLRKGEFDEALLKSIIANYRRGEMAELENNFARAYKMEAAFINGLDWADVATELDRAAKITKEEIVAWAKENLPAEGYCVVYKRQGEDKSQKKIDKPTITPISANRDAQSDYLTAMQNTTVEPIAPVFVDYEKDMSRTSLRDGVEVLYKQNNTNELFSLIYLYDFGTSTVKSMELAINYMALLGTDKMSAEEFQRKMYDLACSFNIIVNADKTYLTINGLSENMEKAMALVEEYLSNLKGDEAILREVKNDTEQQRLNAKASQQENFYALQNYCLYGADYIRHQTLSDNELKEITSEELIANIKELSSIKHRVMYYGPKSLNDLTAQLAVSHKAKNELRELKSESVPTKAVTEPSVLFAQYDAKQVYYLQYSCRAEDKFDVKMSPLTNLYNNYFSGGMNAIVFQEMREARGLAYSASTYLSKGQEQNHPLYYIAFIATQNDKVQQAVEAFDEIIEDMPRSEAAFELAKSGMLANLESKRTTKMDVLWSYIDAEKFGLKEDAYKTIYEGIKPLTLDDVAKFQQEYIKGRAYTYCILGDKSDLDMGYIGGLGKIKFLSQEEIFG